MKDSLAVGLSGTSDFEVTPELCTGHSGVSVLATPRMIGLMEVACASAMAPHLDEGETSMGVHVCVSHEAPARLGQRFTIAFELAKIERRRLTFNVKVSTADAVVSQGTHQRAVVTVRKA